MILFIILLVILFGGISGLFNPFVVLILESNEYS